MKSPVGKYFSCFIKYWGKIHRACDGVESASTLCGIVWRRGEDNIPWPIEDLRIHKGISKCLDCFPELNKRKHKKHRRKKCKTCGRFV